MLDDKIAGFRFEVRTEFTQAGRLGFEFSEPKDDNDKRVRVSNVHGGTPAAAQPLVCVGLYLTRIKCGTQQAELSAEELGFNRVMEMMPDRPLVLIFEHPWQRIDDPEPYYFNSETEASRWDRPPELDAVLAAMKTWKNTTTAQPQQQQPQIANPAVSADDAPRQPAQPEGQVSARLSHF